MTAPHESGRAACNIATAKKTTHREFTPDQKQLASLIARFSLAGHAVHKGQEHDYTVIRRKFGMSRYCPDFAALEAFARLVGVTHG